VKALAERGFQTVVVDLDDKVDPNLLKPYDTVISCIGPEATKSQGNLVTAAKAAGTKRFVPCGFITICPPGGIMQIRDIKEEVYNQIFIEHLPYTIIDTGFWHQFSYPKLPSGRVDKYHAAGDNKVYGNGNAPNLLTDLRDIGPWVARIIKDPRTLNKKVFTWSDELSQNEINALVEKISGEKIETTPVSFEENIELVTKARETFKAQPTDMMTQINLWVLEYQTSKYFRADNTRENALYLGYLDGKELYPDFKGTSFEAFFKETLEGHGRRPYADRF